MKRVRVTFLKMQNKNGIMEDAVEIVDMENKTSLGIYRIEKNAQCIVKQPVDMPEKEAVYKNYFEISKE